MKLLEHKNLKHAFIPFSLTLQSSRSSAQLRPFMVSTYEVTKCHQTTLNLKPDVLCNWFSGSVTASAPSSTSAPSHRGELRHSSPPQSTLNKKVGDCVSVSQTASFKIGLYAVQWSLWFHFSCVNDMHKQRRQSKVTCSSSCPAPPA